MKIEAACPWCSEKFSVHLDVTLSANRRTVSEEQKRNDQEARELFRSLTPRDRLYVAWMMRGLNNVELARRVGNSPCTAKTRISEIYAKFEVHTRAQAILFVERYPLLRQLLAETIR